MNFIPYYGPSPPSCEVANNSLSYFRQFLNYLKGCNPWAARSLPQGELILDNNPKGKPLVPSHHTEVINCRYLLHRVWHPPHDRRYIRAYMHFNWLLSVALSSVGRENLKPSGTRENTLLWKLLFCMQKRNDLVTIFFPPWIPLIYVYMGIYLYMCCVSFGILTDSVIILFTMTRLHMQAHKAYAKCYHSHLYMIQLCYSSTYGMGFTDWYTQTYIYIYTYMLKEKNTSLWKIFCLFIWREMTSVWLLYFFLFVWNSIWEWHDLVMYSIYGIEKSDASRENPYCLYIIHRKTTSLLNNFC